MRKMFLLLGAVATLSACKKNEDSPTSSRTDLLTAKSWRLSTVTATFNGLPVPSSLILQDCTKDDFYKFNTDKTLVQDAGPIKCAASDPQTQTGSWALNSDQSKLTIAITGNPLSGEADVKELTDSKLRVTGAPSMNGVSYTFDATFVPN